MYAIQSSVCMLHSFIEVYGNTHYSSWRPPVIILDRWSGGNLSRLQWSQHMHELQWEAYIIISLNQLQVVNEVDWKLIEARIRGLYQNMHSTSRIVMMPNLASLVAPNICDNLWCNQGDNVDIISWRLSVQSVFSGVLLCTCSIGENGNILFSH